MSKPTQASKQVGVTVNRPVFLQAAVVLAALLAASGSISFIAANWATMHAWLRMGLVVAGILTCVSFSTQQCLKHKGWGAEYSLQKITAGLAAILVGALLVVVSQHYQSGADAWGLFALWAVLIVPWLIAVRSIFIMLLWVVLVNVSALLYLTPYLDNSASPILALVALNMGLWWVAQATAQALGDEYGVIEKLCLVFFLSALMAFTLQSYYYLDGGVAFYLVQQLLKVIVGLWLLRYYQQRHQFLSIALLYGFAFAFVIEVAVWLAGYAQVGEAGSILLCLLVVGCGVGLLCDVYRRWRSAAAYADSSSASSETTGRTAISTTAIAVTPTARPWYLRVLQQIVLLCSSAAVLAILYLVMQFDPQSASLPLALVSVVVAVVVGRKQRSALMDDIATLFLLLAVWLAWIGISYVSSSGSVTWLLCLVLPGVLVYYLCANWNMRFVAAFWVVSFLLFWWLPEHSIYPTRALFWLPLYEIVLTVGTLFVAGLAYSHQQRHYEYWSPLFWVMLFITSYSVLDYMTIIDVMARYGLTSTVDLPRAQLGGVQAWLAYLPMLWWAVLPAAYMAYTLRKVAVAPRFKVATVVVLSLLALIWLQAAAFLWLLLWLLVAYCMRQRVLLVYSAITLVGFLAYTYHGFMLNLVHMAVITLCSTVVLLAYAMVCRGSSASSAATEHTVLAPLPSLQRIWVLWLGVAVVVAVVGTIVWTKQKVLRQGTSVTLALAPVDPRSLVQGDYMVLSYQMSQHIQQWLCALPDVVEVPCEGRQQATVWLAPPTQEGEVAWVAQGIQRANEPLVFVFTNHVGHTPNGDVTTQSITTLPNHWRPLSFVKKGGWWQPITGNSWLFSEGDGAHYEQARYGQFVITETGQAILRHVVDADGKVLE